MSYSIMYIIVTFIAFDSRWAFTCISTGAWLLIVQSSYFLNIHACRYQLRCSIWSSKEFPAVRQNTYAHFCIVGAIKFTFDGWPTIISVPAVMIPMVCSKLLPNPPIAEAVLDNANCKSLVPTAKLFAFMLYYFMPYKTHKINLILSYKNRLYHYLYNRYRTLRISPTLLASSIYIAYSIKNSYIY